MGYSEEFVKSYTRSHGYPPPGYKPPKEKESKATRPTTFDKQAAAAQRQYDAGEITEEELNAKLRGRPTPKPPTDPIANYLQNRISSGLVDSLVTADSAAQALDPQTATALKYSLLKGRSAAAESLLSAQRRAGFTPVQGQYFPQTLREAQERSLTPTIARFGAPRPAAPVQVPVRQTLNPIRLTDDDRGIALWNAADSGTVFIKSNGKKIVKQ